MFQAKRLLVEVFVYVLIGCCQLTAAAGPITSPDFPVYPNCEARLTTDPLAKPIQTLKGSDQLYDKTASRHWELDDYGPVYRYARGNYGQSNNLTVEEYNPSLDVGPSPLWIQTLQKLGQLPPALNGIPWSQIEAYMRDAGLYEFQHPARERHLNGHRMKYAEQLWPGFQFALSQYPRRAWFTPEFKVGAEETFNKTLRNASYIFLRETQSKKPVASIRMVRVHNGLLRLRHIKTGRVLELTGNAESTWGVDGKFRAGWPMMYHTFEVEKGVKEFLASPEQTVKRDSLWEPIDMVRLPMEQSLHIELPRDWQTMELRGQQGFGPNAIVKVNGEEFAAEFAHAVLVEPGLFALEKNEQRGANFIELTLWMSKYLANPRLPDWVNARKVAYWTYNDLPLYKMFGFKEDKNFAPVHKYGVKWIVYGAGYDSVFSALDKLSNQRTDGDDRQKRINEFLREMETRGF